MIAGIKFFIRKGADQKYIDKNGEDIFTYVKNPKVIAYLKTL